MAKLGKYLQLLAGILLFVALARLHAQSKSPGATQTSHNGTREKIVRYVRERFSIPDTVKLAVGDFRDSAFPDFYVTTITLDDGKQQRSQNFFVSKDERYLVEGNIFTLGADAKREIANAISLEDQPSLGPANAPVTIVEYADLQCPSCALLHNFLEKEVVPKYGDKVRVVFKEFPLTNIHEWSLTGAVAAQCAYQIDPAKYVPFRSLVYQNQTTVNADNSRDMLLHFAAQAGIDNLQLASCIDAKTSLPRVEANAQEAQALGITQTPTTFVNGRIVVGAPEPAAFFKIIDEALHGAT